LKLIERIRTKEAQIQFINEEREREDKGLAMEGHF